VQYRLEAQKLLKTLAHHASTGTLVANVPAGPIEIVLEQGKVVACRFAHLSGAEAFKAITQQGIIQWTFTITSATAHTSQQQRSQAHPTMQTSYTPPPQSLHPPGGSGVSYNQARMYPSTALPRRTALRINPNTMPRHILMIYAFIDGNTSVGDLAQRSGQPYNVVEQVIQYLQSLNLIMV